jgi:hypothetical protein
VKEKIPWWDRLNGALMPYIGPPQLGPYGEAPLPAVGTRACPICGRLLADHTFERGEGRTATRMHCPTAA